MLEIQTPSRHPVSQVAFSPDGSVVAFVQAHAGVTLCARATGQVTAAMPVPRAGGVVTAAFCDGGAKLLVGTQRRLYLFDAATGSALAVAAGWMFAAAELTAGGESVLARSWAGIREIRLPRAPGESLLSLSPRLTGRGGAVALSPCGRWLVSSYSRIPPSLTRIDLRRVVATLSHPHRSDGFAALAATFAADGSRVALSDGNDVAVFDTPAEQEPEVVSQESEIRRAESERTGKNGSSKPGALLQTSLPIAPKPRVVLEPVFRLPPPEGYRPAAPHPQFVNENARPNLRWHPPVALTPDGRGLLVRRPRNRVQLWDVASGQLAGEWSWRLEVTSLAVAPDGLTAVAGARLGRAVMWDME